MANDVSVMQSSPSIFTPPQLARRWGVAADKVNALIKSGELKAMNLALNGKGERPRYRIYMREVIRFEEERSNQLPELPKPKRRRRTKAAAGKDYFPDQ